MITKRQEKRTRKKSLLHRFQQGLLPFIFGGIDDAHYTTKGVLDPPSLSVCLSQVRAGSFSQSP
jgi:hypothetical protein